MLQDKQTSSSESESERELHVQELVLPKSCILKAIDSMLQSDSVNNDQEVKNMKSVYSRKVSMEMGAQCYDHSVFPDYNGRSVDNVFLSNSLRPVMLEMRLALLAGDWDNYKELLLMLFSSPNVSNKHIMFLIRSCFVLMLSHPKRTPELLDQFMCSCLNINEESRRLQYLEQCFKLIETRADDLDNISETSEEEMLFYSDISNSDSD
ncbi:uncharacterized protein LOC126838953 [Adelges cooleyi]|uniref:uncharacterized protein LOC126838953 n=1 Tax=Adelges cooleyi TaxID=133065 RepID=UPI00217F70DD|nr:uncharacterized protein LOC126838953 [Adelges cooleyi]